MALNKTLSGLGMISSGLIALLVLYFVYMRFIKHTDDVDSKDIKNDTSADEMARRAAEQAALALKWNNSIMSDDNVTEQYSDVQQVEPAPLGFTPFGSNDDSAYFADYPQSEDPSSLTSDGSASAYDISLDSLMPASWRGAKDCDNALESEGFDGEWSKYAPSKQSYENYIIAAGSARLGMNTRTRNPTGGIQNLLRPPAPVPVSAANILFNDSSFRQDVMHDSVGYYPSQVSC